MDKKPFSDVFMLLLTLVMIFIPVIGLIIGLAVAFSNLGCPVRKGQTKILFMVAGIMILVYVLLIPLFKVQEGPARVLPTELEPSEIEEVIEEVLESESPPHHGWSPPLPEAKATG